MNLEHKIAVVTGGASGIGRALACRFAREGAGAVIVADHDAEGATAVASEIGGVGVAADVAVEADIEAIVREAERRFGRIDLFCSNAGIGSEDGATVTSAPNELWHEMWQIHVMAHVYAARAALPRMLERREGYFLNTVSAAGLLSNVTSGPYSTTKHAAIGFAESLAIAHGDQGIKVSVICPQAVRTPMLGDLEDGGPHGADGVLESDDVAESVIQGLNEERFLILPHPNVLNYIRHKAADYDRWLRGMRRHRAKFVTP